MVIRCRSHPGPADRSVRLEPNTPFHEAWSEKPTDAHAGVLFTSDADIAALRAHFRHYTMANIPTKPDAPVYFWFYDPRVLLDFVSACDGPNLARLFGGITEFYVPLSPSCLVPSEADIALPPTPFDNMSSCAGRYAVLAAVRGAVLHSTRRNDW